MFASDIDVSKIEFGEVTEKNIKISYNGDKLEFQTPKMTVPFDLEERKYQGKLFLKNIACSTKDCSSQKNNEQMKAFDKKIREIEVKIKSMIPEKHKDKIFYSSLYQSDTKYKPVFKIKIPYNDNECSISIYDNNNKKVGDSKLYKRIMISTIIYLENIWFYKDKMGLTWTAKQMKIFDDQPRINNMYSNKFNNFSASAKQIDDNVEEKIINKTSYQVRLEDTE